MFPHLTNLGIKDPSLIERYSLRQEAQSDILKIYFYKQKGELFAKSIKYKFPRQQKTVLVDSGSHQYKDVSEINRHLVLIIDELNSITEPQNVPQDQDIKAKLLDDLQHLEKVMMYKLKEIRNDIARL